MRSTIITLAAVALLAGCTSGSGVSVGATSDPNASLRVALESAAAAQAALPTCAETFVAGKQVTVRGAQMECKDPDGTVQVIGLFRCNDGTHIGSVEPRAGAPRGWFRAPGPFHVVKGDVANDKGYSTAYAKCNG